MADGERHVPPPTKKRKLSLGRFKEPKSSEEGYVPPNTAKSTAWGVSVSRLEGREREAGETTMSSGQSICWKLPILPSSTSGCLDLSLKCRTLHAPFNSFCPPCNGRCWIQITINVTTNGRP